MMNRIAIAIGMVCTLLLGSGCNNRLELPEVDGGLDYSKMIEVNLAGVSLSEGVPSPSRAGGETEVLLPMPVGNSFRLYAFPKGKWDLNDTILTRTYTIRSRPGNPVLDPDQKKLFLPMGNVDIFLIGPSSVATPYGVYPEYNEDLVSSLTRLVVEPGANQFQASPLRHRMAKVQVVINKLDNSNYERFKVNSVSLMNQVRFGDFVFDDQGGQIVPTGEGLDEFSPGLVVDPTTGTTTGTMYIIPRNSVQMRIGLLFECYMVGASDKVDRRMNSGIMENISLPAGKITRFITTPKLSDKLEFRIRLLPWNEVLMPDEGLTAGDSETLFSYSGLDAPIALNGKSYWPDRSGRGRHAELVGDIRYNAKEYYYYAASREAYIKVPDLGTVPVYTLEMTAESAYGLRSVPAWCRAADGTRHLQVQLPGDQNTVSFQSPAAVAVSNNGFPLDRAYLEGVATHAFTKTASQLAYHYNGKQLTSASATTTPYPLNDLRLAYWPGTSVDGGYYTQDLSKFKLYAVRLTAKDMSAIADALPNNYRDDMAAYSRIDVAKDYASQEYIKSGLALDLRGETVPSTSIVPGKKVWADLSGAGNHAVFTHSSNDYPTHNATDDCYTFTGANGNESLRLFSLGLVNEFTMEIVLSNKAVGNFVPFAAHSRALIADRDRELSVLWPWDNRVVVDSPFNLSDERVGTENQAIQSVDALPYPTLVDQVHSLSITRAKGRLVARQNGVLISDVEADVLLKTMLYVSIGASADPTVGRYNGNIHAVRFYNRPLTENERKLNYRVDKAKYNILK